MPADQSEFINVAFAHHRHIGASDSRQSLEDFSEATPVRLADGQMVTLGMIADGMGGIEGGEIASRTAVETALSFLQSGSPANLPALVQGALLDAQQRVLAKRKELGFNNMGTTATLAIITPDARLFLAHVGDSRAYLVRDGHLFQLTLDHAWGEEQVRQEKLTPEEAAIHDRRDALNRYIGQNKSLKVDLGIWLDGGRESQREAEARQGYELVAGDTVMLCSDGLIKQRPASQEHFVEPHEIVQLVGSLTPYDAVHQLVNLAVERQVDDNVSVVILYIQSRSARGTGALGPTIAPGVDETVSKDEIMRRILGDTDLTFDDIVRGDSPAPPPPATLPEPAHPTRPRARQRAARAAAPRERSRRLGAGIIALLVVAGLLTLGVLFVAFVLPTLDSGGAILPGRSPGAEEPGIQVSEASGTIRYSTGGDPRPVQSGDTLPADRHLVLTFDAGSRARLDLPDGTVLYAGDEIGELWLTPNPNAGQANAPDTMVRLIGGRLLVTAWASDQRGFLLYTPNEDPWIELEGATMGVRRIVDRAAGIEEVTLECLDGSCTLLTPQTIEVGACQRVRLASGEVIPPTVITASNWTALAGSDLPPSAICGN